MAESIVRTRASRKRPARACEPQPRPTNGIFVAMIVIVSTLVSSGRLAMKTTARATCATSMRGSGTHPPVGLLRAGRHPLGQRGDGVADVDLPAGDVVGAAVEGEALREPADAVLGDDVGRRVRARRHRRDRSVVDDPAALRPLRLHHAERTLRAQEHAGQVDVDDRLPPLVGQILERRAGAGARVVEQQIQPAPRVADEAEQRVDGVRLRDVGRDGQRAIARARRALRSRRAPRSGGQPARRDTPRRGGRWRRRGRCRSRLR